MSETFVSAPIAPLLCTIPQAAAAIARGQRFIYEAIATNKIQAVKSDGRTLIIVESLRTYVAGLPPAKIKAVIRKRRKAA